MTTEEPESRLFSRSRPRRVLLWVIGLLLGLVAILLVGSIALTVLVDAEYLERRINSSLDGAYTVEIESVRWQLWSRSLHADGIRLIPRSVPEKQQTDAPDRSATQYHARARQIHLDGIHLWAYLWRGDVGLESVTIQHPFLHVEQSTNEEKQPANTERTETTDTSATTMKGALANRLPNVSVGQVIVREGAASMDRGPQRPTPTDSLWGFSMHADDVAIDSASAQDTSRVLFSRQLRLRFDGYRHVGPDSLYATTVGPVQASSSDSLLTLEAFEAQPTVPDSVYMQRRGHRTNRLVASIESLALRGVNYRRFVEDRALLLRSAHLDSLLVDVYRDNRLPPPPTDPPPEMPHEIVQSMDRALRIDTIRVQNGVARYAKWEEGAPGPGSISFQRIYATIRNVTNDPQRMSASTPAVVDATTLVAGEGRLTTTIRLPLLSPDFSLSYTGRLGPMNARAFNDAFVNLSGVRIEQGRIDSLWFAAEIDSAWARGTLHGIYRDLEVIMVDKSGDRGLGDRIKSFILDDLILKSGNPREDSELRTGKIEDQQQQDETFFKFLWHSVRSGMYSLVGL